MPTTVRSRRAALVTAPLVTALAVGAGVATTGFARPTPPPANAAASSLSAAAALVARGTAPTTERTLGTTRSEDRVPLVDRRVPVAKGRQWATSALDLRLEPRERSATSGTLKSGQRIAVTGLRQGAYAEVIVGPVTRWVTAQYLSAKKPVAPSARTAAQGLSDAPCPDGSGIESALQPASVKVYRAVCAAFPELTTYGGQDGHGEHVNGEAIDFMVPSSSVGERVKDFVYAHRAELDLFDIIWSQHIWTIERASEGFRSMEDRGSATANHFDHVHIKIN